jgi:glycerol kinase
MQQLQITADQIAGIGITNQRETTVIWDRKTGKPIHNAIVWQDRRTASVCDQLKADGLEKLITSKTGLLPDAYFSATKISWLLDNVPGAREKANRGELAFGTIDTWLAWNITQGKHHITDVSNASRSLLYNIHTLEWDTELLALFNIPASLLPQVKSSCEHYGFSNPELLGAAIPLLAMLGDQQAALFGQLCTESGMGKCTYGTGSFLMLNTGKTIIHSNHHLLSTIAWQIGSETHYALEGSVFMGGAIMQWLRDGLQLFKETTASEALARQVDDNGGVYFVPALTGLGAPYWDGNARGAIFGITRGTTSAHITRAALESIAFQVDDVLQLLISDSGIAMSELRIDGGAAANDLLLQFQADISNLTILRPKNLETTALGAAYLAGIASGLWTIESLQQHWQIDREFKPALPDDEAAKLKQRWGKAVDRTLDWL